MNRVLISLSTEIEHEINKRKECNLMNPGEGPYHIRRMHLRQDDIWTLPDGSPQLTVVGEPEEFFVIGRLVRNNVSRKEVFVPNRSPNGKITTTERSEGMARLICYNLNVTPFNSICQRIPDAPPKRRSLLAYAALHYFSPGLDFATTQSQKSGYDTALKYLIGAAPQHETWYIGECVVCMNQGDMVLIKSPQTPSSASTLITIGIAELATLAWPPSMMIGDNSSDRGDTQNVIDLTIGE